MGDAVSQTVARPPTTSSLQKSRTHIIPGLCVVDPPCRRWGRTVVQHDRWVRLGVSLNRIHVHSWAPWITLEQLTLFAKGHDGGSLLPSEGVEGVTREVGGRSVVLP